MRAWSVAVAAAAAALWLSACEGKPQRPLVRGEGAPSVGERVSVLSGDTFVLDGRHLRVANAFAPEPIPRARCWSEAIAAKLAARYTQQLMREARAIDVRPIGQRDEYNREFAFVTLDGLDLGQTLYDEGLAGQPGTRRFPWCNPISSPAEGAPTIGSLMELKPR